MIKLKIVLASVIIALGLGGCNSDSDQVPPSMTEVSLQICGNQVIGNKIGKACFSNTIIYWGEVEQKDIHLIKMTRGIDGKIDYYFVVVSATGCVADLSSPRPTITEIVAIKSMFSEKVSGKLPEVKLLSMVEVEEKKRKLLVEESKEKIAFATQMGSQTAYTQPVCQNFRPIQQKLNATGYKEISYPIN